MTLIAFPLVALIHVGYLALRKSGSRKAILVGIAYVHLLTVVENPALSTLGTLLRFPIWGLAVLQVLSLEPGVRVRELLPKSFKLYAILLALFLVWASISLLWSANRTETIIKVTNFTLIVIFLYLSFVRRWAKSDGSVLEDLKAIINPVVLFIFISAVLTMPSILTALGGMVRYQGVFQNPNTLAGLAALCFYPAVHIYMNSRRKIFLFGPIVLILALILAGSRSSTLAIVLAGLLVLVLSVLRNVSRLNKMMPPLFAFMYVGIVSYLFFRAKGWASSDESTINALPRQLNFAVSDTLFNGREELWLLGLDLFKERPLLGYGFNGTRTVVKDLIENGFYFVEVAQLHNSYLEILVDLGAVGAVFYFTALLIVIRQVIQNVEASPLLSAGVISPLVLALSESVLFGLSSVAAFIFWTLSVVIFSPQISSRRLREEDEMEHSSEHDSPDECAANRTI